MYAYIKGELVALTPSTVTLEANGMGYQISIPANVFSKLPQIGNKVLLHTSFVVRELSHTLYGFLSQQERDLFELFMSVTGIGPKLALSLVGHMPIHNLQHAISNHEIATICKIPGIGKKTAERLIIELRDKFGAISFERGSEKAFVSASDPKTQKISDAMGALINLGYNQSTAQRAIKKTLQESSEEIDLATLITATLKNV